MAREKTPEEQTTDNERKQLAEEKKKLPVQDLLAQFERASGDEFTNDRALLS